MENNPRRGIRNEKEDAETIQPIMKASSLPVRHLSIWSSLSRIPARKVADDYAIFLGGLKP